MIIFYTIKSVLIRYYNLFDLGITAKSALSDWV